jgi:predicted methyltransferase
MAKQRCIICRKALNNGIIINGRVICKSCEGRVVNSKINTDFYNYYRDCIKKTLVDLLPKDGKTQAEIYR